jgi:hypothetical protein
MVLSINFQASAQPRFLIYKTTVPSVTPEYVTDIATRIFHVPNPNIEYRDGLYIVENDYPRYLQVYEASGFIGMLISRRYTTSHMHQTCHRKKKPKS